MKTFALVLAAALALPVVAHAAGKPAKSQKAKTTKRSAPKPPAKPMVLNYSLSGQPFYSSHRVLSMM